MSQYSIISALNIMHCLNVV